MKKPLKPVCALLLALTVSLSLMAGCAGETASPPETSSAPESTAAASGSEAPASAAPESAQASPESPAAPSEEADDGLPLVDEKTTLSLFVNLPDNVKQYFTDVQDLDGYKAAEEMTNVHIDATAVSNDAFNEQFNLMVASGDYTDMLRDVNTAYSGGLARALSDEVILDLTDLLSQYGQDYLSYTTQSDTVAKSVVNDDGRYLAVYGIAMKEQVEQGWLIRQDYLDAVGMEMPKTVDQWEKVLTAFRDELSLSDPFLVQNNLYAIADAFGAGNYMAEAANPMNYATWLYNENGTVKACFLEDAYRDFLVTMNRWYSEGLIGADFYSNGGEHSDTYRKIFYGGNAGVFWCTNLSECGNLSAYTGDDVALSPMPYPAVNEGDLNQFGAKREMVRSSSLSISGQCENPELAMKWMNFWFSTPGANLANYGIQGKSWDYDESGNWHFTDLIMNNPDGLTQMEARSLYTFSSVPSAIDPAAGAAAYGDWEWSCVDLWGSTSTGAYRLLSTIALNEEESEVYNANATTIETYGAESVIKFVTGELNLQSDWETFKQTCLELGVQQCIDAYQGAVTRFETR